MLFFKKRSHTADLKYVKRIFSFSHIICRIRFLPRNLIYLDKDKYILLKSSSQCTVPGGGMERIGGGAVVSVQYLEEGWRGPEEGQ